MKYLFLLMIIIIIGQFIACTPSYDKGVVKPVSTVSDTLYPYDWDTVTYTQHFNGKHTFFDDTKCQFNEEYITIGKHEYVGKWINKFTFVSNDSVNIFVSPTVLVVNWPNKDIRPDRFSK